MPILKKSKAERKPLSRTACIWGKGPWKPAVMPTDIWGKGSWILGAGTSSLSMIVCSVFLILPLFLLHILPQRTGTNSYSPSSSPWRSAWERWWAEPSSPWRLCYFRSWPTACPSAWCWRWEETSSSVRRWVSTVVCTEVWTAGVPSSMGAQPFERCYF